jgi:hypothetical protein
MVNLATSLNPTAFVQHRLNVLANEAKEAQQTTDASKTVGLAAVLFCLCNIANPLALVLLYVAAINYAISVAVDAYRTRDLYILPVVRKNIPELFAVILKLLDNNSNDDDDDEIDDRHLYQLKYLRPEQEYEHWLLTTFPQQIIHCLSNTPHHDRAIVYQTILASRHNIDNNPLTFKPETITSPLPQQAQTIAPTPQQAPIPKEITPIIESEPTVDPWADVDTVEMFDRRVVSNTKDQFFEIVNRNNSFFVVGSKGAGKGIVTSNILHHKLAQYPNAIALVLDPKADEKEDGYHDHPRIIRHKFRGIHLDRAGWCEMVVEYMAEARHMIGQVDVRKGKRLFLVADELLGLKTNLDRVTFDELKTFFSNGISMGDSEGIHAIAITQSFNAGDSFDSDELLKNLCLIGVFTKDDYARAKKIVNYGKVNLDSFSVGDFQNMVTQSDVNRVLTVGGVFMAAPKLKNYSGHDRDAL